MTDDEARSLKPGDRVYWHRPALAYPREGESGRESVESSTVVSVTPSRGNAGVTLDPPMDMQTILSSAVPSRSLERSEADVWRACCRAMRAEAREFLERAREYRAKAREAKP